MVNYSTQSLVITGLVFAGLILNIVGAVTPLFTLTYDYPDDKGNTTLQSIAVYIYFSKSSNKDQIPSGKTNCTTLTGVDKDYCILSQSFCAALLCFSSLLFLLMLLIQFIGFNSQIKLLSIILNVLTLLIVGGLVTVLSLMMNRDHKEIGPLNFTIGPSAICFGVSSILSIVSLVLFTTLKLKAKK
tara:strand:- start:99 stop:656 length:558 start_codon:yes stop_codon:yes gene_type:complete